MKQFMQYFMAGLAGIFIAWDAAAADTNQLSGHVLDLINQIRFAPFEQARALGYEENFLHLRNIFADTAYPLYQADPRLSDDAAHANRLMAEDPPVSSPGDPCYLLTAETGSIVASSNFMDGETAARIFIENAFKAELDSNAFSYILAPDFRRAGISVMSGPFENGMNAWYFTLSLGSLISISEMQVLTMINEVRSEPWQIRAYLANGPWAVFQENANVYHMMSNTYPPLFLDTALHSGASADNFYMMNRGYPGGISFGPEPVTPHVLAAFYGFQGQAVQEAGTAVVCAKNDTQSCASLVFLSLILDEFRTWPENALVFSSAFQTAGPALEIRNRQNTDLAISTLFAGTAAPASDSHPGTARIYGVLFSDTDGNTAYSPGEEIAGQTISVFDDAGNLSRQTITDNAGHFFLALESGRVYTIQTALSGSIISNTVFADGDQFFKLAAPPPF